MSHTSTEERITSEHLCAVCGTELVDDNALMYECEHCINLADE